MPLYVPLDDAALARLRLLARRERRRPQDQAAILIERALVDHEPPAHDRVVDAAPEEGVARE